MIVAYFTFLPDLNTFLSPDRRSGQFDYCFEPGQSVKHLIEASGVPHTEVGQLRINDSPAGLETLLQNDDRVEIVPATAADDPLPGEARFVLDNHLGRLAAYLRMLGFDCIYRNDFDDGELARISEQDNRILLTRDRRLLMRKAVRYGYCLRSLDSRQQLDEILRRYNLIGQDTPFKRCLRCNTPLEPVSKSEVFGQLEPLTQLYYEDFHRCPACGQVYWKGSHYERMQDMIEKIHRQGG